MKLKPRLARALSLSVPVPRARARRWDTSKTVAQTRDAYLLVSGGEREIAVVAARVTCWPLFQLYSGPAAKQLAQLAALLARPRARAGALAELDGWQRELRRSHGVPLFFDTAARASRDSAVSRGSCLLYTSPSPRDGLLSRMPSSA